MERVFFVRGTYVEGKKGFSKKAIFVCQPLIHPDPFVVRLRRYIRGPLNYLTSIFGYRSLFHMLQGFDAITVSTPYEYSFLTSYGLNNVWFVGEGVNTEFIEGNKDKIRQKAIKIREDIKSENVVTFIGFRDKYKGYYDFLKAVIDWSPPKSLMAFEDYHLTQHILQKGYLVIQINKPLALHAPGLTANLRRLINKTAWNGAGIRTTKAMKPSELIVYLLGRTIQGLLPGQYPTLRYAGYKNQIIYIASLCGYIIGYAVPHKYLIPER
jgi:hypothetical protein